MSTIFAHDTNLQHMKASYLKHQLLFKDPAGTSRGILTQKPAWILQIKDNNKTGTGEISRLPGLSYDDNQFFESKLDHIIQRINTGEKIEPILEDTLSLPSIRFAIETALLDINSQKSILYNTPFTQGKQGILINGLIWMGDMSSMNQQIDQKLAQGYTCIKLKIGSNKLNDELTLIQTIRKRYSCDSLQIRVDANGAFTPQNAPHILEKLAQLKVHSIEQPIAQHQRDEMEVLCAKTPLPIALDEELIGVYKTQEMSDLITKVKPQYIILKPGLLGGFSICEHWIKLATELNIGFWITSALESNIGLSAIAQWTSTRNTTIHQGLGTGSLYTNNFISPLYIDGEKLFFDPNKLK